MTLSRRALFRTVGTGAAVLSPAAITARGREAMVAEPGTLAMPFIPPPEGDEIRISSNENPVGPGPSAIAAIRDNMAQCNRYPMNSTITDRALRERLAQMNGVHADNIVLAPGSSEILRNCVRSFTSADRALVTAELSYGSPVETAEFFDRPVKKIANTPELGLDLGKMAGAAVGAGLVFFCQPNNPSGTVHSARDVHDFVRWVSKESPYTYVLIDEAYHDYVTDPAYQTSMELAMRYPNIIVGRTFSKAYGMAGLRMGYAVADKPTAAKLRALKLTFGTNVLGIAAVSGSLDDPENLANEVKRNTAARQYTIDWFNNNGFWTTNSQTNFIFAKTGMTAKAFREACAKYDVIVGRDFPPYEKVHARISIGTLEEMQRATEVFGRVLGVSATDAGSGRN